MKYEIIVSLLLRDKFGFPATIARSMAERYSTQAKDLAGMPSMNTEDFIAEFTKDVKPLFGEMKCVNNKAVNEK
jgi:hypothetical protein